MQDELEKLFVQAHEARREHRSADARPLLVEALALARQREGAGDLARALTGLGQIERDLKNTQAALKLYQEAVAIYHAQGDVLRLAHTVRQLGDIYRQDGELAPAELCYQDALKIYRAHPDTAPLDLANTLRGFAILKQELDQKPEAKLFWTEAGKLYESVNVQAGVAESARRITQLSS